MLAVCNSSLLASANGFSKRRFSLITAGFPVDPSLCRDILLDDAR